MASMEKKDKDYSIEGTTNTTGYRCSSYSWRWDSHNHSRQSQWLHSTLSDLDKKIKTVLNVLEDDGDSFAKRAEMYYEKRPELIKTIQEIHRSYRSLAENYDQLRPDQSNELGHSSKSLPISFKKEAEPIETSLEKKPQTLTPHDEVAKPETSEGSNSENECDEKADLPTFEEAERLENSYLKMSELIEEHLRQQAKLIEKNEEKRNTIRSLCIHINKLVEENKAFKSSLARSKSVAVKQKQSSMSKMKEAVLGKLMH